MTNNKKPLEDVYMWENSYCSDCHWPIVCFRLDSLNDGVHDLPDPYNEFDYWVYCANPTCKRHGGEGYFQYCPKWVIVRDYVNAQTPTTP